MIHYYTVENSGTVKHLDALEGANWIHLEDPSEQEIVATAAACQFPVDYLYSTLDPDEVSRGEKIQQREVEKPVLISLLYPRQPETQRDQGIYETRTMSMILTRELVVTCAKQNPEFFDLVLHQEFALVKQPINERCLLIELCWHIARAYVFAIRDINTRVDVIHKSLRQSTKSETLLQLSELDKSIVYLSTAISENHPIIRELSNALYLADTEPRREWLHDVLVENHQAEKMIDQTRQLLVQLDTTFSSIIQNNLNEIMKILTSLTIIVTIPCVTAGFYGMNVGLPFAQNPLAFWGVVLITILLCAITVVWLKKRDLM